MLSLREQMQERDRIIISRFMKRLLHSKLLSTFAAWSEFSVESKRHRMIVQRFVRRWKSMQIMKTFSSWHKFTTDRIEAKGREIEKQQYEEKMRKASNYNLSGSHSLILFQYGFP